MISSLSSGKTCFLTKICWFLEIKRPHRVALTMLNHNNLASLFQMNTTKHKKEHYFSLPGWRPRNTWNLETIVLKTKNYQFLLYSFSETETRRQQAVKNPKFTHCLFPQVSSKKNLHWFWIFLPYLKIDTSLSRRFCWDRLFLFMETGCGCGSPISCYSLGCVAGRGEFLGRVRIQLILFVGFSYQTLL